MASGVCSTGVYDLVLTFILHFSAHASVISLSTFLLEVFRFSFFFFFFFASFWKSADFSCFEADV